MGMDNIKIARGILPDVKFCSPPETAILKFLKKVRMECIMSK